MHVTSNYHTPHAKQRLLWPVVVAARICMFMSRVLQNIVILVIVVMAQKIGSFDVILQVGDVSFPCHRRILAECSPYFQAMFGNNFIERDKATVEIQACNLYYFFYFNGLAKYLIRVICS